MHGPIALTTVQWAQVAAPFLAAAAAVASWFSALQARQLAVRATLPRLVLVLSYESSKRAVIAVRNVGAGPALVPSVYAVWGGERFKHGFEDGVVGTGGELVEKRVLQSTEIGTGVAICRDLRGNWHIWSSDGRHVQPRRWPRRRLKSLGFDQALLKLYPDIDVGKLKDVR